MSDITEQRLNIVCQYAQEAAEKGNLVEKNIPLSGPQILQLISDMGDALQAANIREVQHLRGLVQIRDLLDKGKDAPDVDAAVCVIRKMLDGQASLVGKPFGAPASKTGPASYKREIRTPKFWVSIEKLKNSPSFTCSVYKLDEKGTHYATSGVGVTPRAAVNSAIWAFRLVSNSVHPNIDRPSQDYKPFILY